MSNGTPVGIPRTGVAAPPQPPWQWPGGLEAAYASEAGAGHARNEDCCSHSPSAERPDFCGVADGVGGGAHGDIASSVLLRHCARASRATYCDPAQLSEWVKGADDEVHSAIARRSDQPGAATLAAAWFPARGVVHVVHVGDCRVYRLAPRDGRYEIERMTVDQTYANLAQTPPPAGRPHDPARMVGAGAVGEPPVQRVNLRAREMLLLCSDGLHRFVSDERIAQVVSEGLSERCSLEAVCGALVRAAKANGSRDDASALLVRRRPWLAGRWRYAGVAIVALLVALVAQMALAETQSVIDPTEAQESATPAPAQEAKKAAPAGDAALKRERQRALEEARRRASAEARAQAAEREAARLRAAKEAREQAAKEAQARKAAAARAAAARAAAAKAARERAAAERRTAQRETAAREAAARELAAREAAREAAEREARELAAREATAKEAAAREAAAREAAAKEAAAREAEERETAAREAAMEAARRATRERALRFAARASHSEQLARSLPRLGTVFRDCPECPELVWLPQGEFLMGERSRRTVRIGYPLAVGRFEITFAEWDACGVAGGCRRRPDDSGWGRGRQPVVNVSWSDAQQYVAWLSRRTGKRYRLLSEAEWEYAARAGSQVGYWWGDEPGRGEANCNGCGSPWDARRAAPVGSFAPNPFGLHDMNGNVSEWVEDCHRDTPSDAKMFDCSLISGRRLVRGGGWRDAPQATRSGARAAAAVTYYDNRIGFRVARTD